MLAATNSRHSRRRGTANLDEVANQICPMECHATNDDGVLRFSKVILNEVMIFRDDGAGSRSVVHSEAHISSSAPDYLVVVPLTGTSAVAQNGALSISEPSRFLLLTTAQPFSAWVLSAGSARHFSQTIVRIPRDKLRQHFPDAEAYINKTFSARSGAARVMVSLLDVALKEGRELSPRGAESLGRMIVETIANALIDSPQDHEDDAATPSPMATVRDRAKRYIESNLADPALNVAQLADHCGVSERYLHSAFAQVAVKVGAFIREQRLLRCRAELLDASRCDRTILQIAMQWGFHDAAHFSRIYKARFGVSPGNDRW